MHEFALRLPVGGPAVMVGRLDHLLRMSTRSYLTLRVVPAARGGHAGIAGQFMLMEFELPPIRRTPHLWWPRPPGRMSRCPHHIPPEFRRRAVELARERTKPIAELAKDLRISESCLRNWVAQAEVDDSGSETRLTSAEKKELTQLRRDRRRLELEVDILKRAAAYSARENILPN
ncbi:MAG: Scr1 family TA system antitoxin-like transcriptional regulator, partial [Actinomycetes bacterium]